MQRNASNIIAEFPGFDQGCGRVASSGRGGARALQAGLRLRAAAVAGAAAFAMAFALMMALVCCMPSYAYADDDAAGDGKGLRAGEMADGMPGSKTVDGYPSTIGAPNPADGTSVKTGVASASGASASGNGFGNVLNISPRSSGGTPMLRDISPAEDGDKKNESVHTMLGVVFPFIPNPTTDEFIASIGEHARKIGQDRGLYASVMIAQAVLESGSGSSGLAKPPYNNLFGIKGSYKGKSVHLLTSEDDGTGAEYDIVAGFRWYPSVRESLEDYADLLTVDMAAFYAPAWKVNTGNYIEACDYLQGHYATDTLYSGKLQGIIEAYHLDQYDFPAKKKSDAKTSAQNKTKLPLTTPTFKKSAIADEDVDAVTGALADQLGADKVETVGSSEQGSSADAETDDNPPLPANPLEDRGVQGAIIVTGIAVVAFARGELALFLKR